MVEDHKYSGEELLVGFGGTSSDDSSTSSVRDESVYEHIENLEVAHSKPKFLRRLLNRKERKMPRQTSLTRIVRKDSACENSVVSNASNNMKKNVEKALLIFNRTESLRRSVFKSEANEVHNPIVFYDIDKPDDTRQKNAHFDDQYVIKDEKLPDSNNSNGFHELPLRSPQQIENLNVPSNPKSLTITETKNPVTTQPTSMVMNGTSLKQVKENEVSTSDENDNSSSNVSHNGILDRLSFTSSNTFNTNFSLNSQVFQVTETGKAFKKKGKSRNRVLMNTTEFLTFNKKIVQKSEETKQMIYEAIKSNILFILWTKDEICEFVDTFEELFIQKGHAIFNEGDEGKYFYVLESGSVNVYKRSNLAGTIEGHGASFGDVALLYDAPRNATFRAETDCKLWIINRKNYLGVCRLNNKSKAEHKIAFLKEVKIGNHILGDVLELSEIYNIALATQNVSFMKGDSITVEGEHGDTFYIIKSGSVAVYIKKYGEEPVATISSGEFIGEKALVEEQGARTATCTVTSDVAECLCLQRKDFSTMLGDVKWMFDDMNYKEKRVSGSIEESKVASQVLIQSEEIKKPTLNFQLSELEIIRTIGVGAFGSVKLVKSKSLKIGRRNQAYVLKCQDLERVEENNMMEHILSERKIMQELDHPFIIKFYGGLVDTEFIYFLLELLQGGELFRLLLSKNRFSERWSQFYSGVVLLAFSEIHAHDFIYRDLKPENLVLDATGYPKIIDFGLAKKLEGGKTWTLCGTPDYMPPEVILNEGHDSAADYWGLGILIFELCNGSPPFASEYPMDVYKNILSGNVNMPAFFSHEVQDLIKQLLNPRQAMRMGRTFGGAKQIMNQEWFSSMDFSKLLGRKVEPPFVPELDNDDDMRYFYTFPQEEQKENKRLEELNDARHTTFMEDKLSKQAKNNIILNKKINKSNRQTQKMSDFNDKINGIVKETGGCRKTFRQVSSAIQPTQAKSKADSFLMIQLMNLALSEDLAGEEEHHIPFRQFSLLSVTPKTLYDMASTDDYSEDESMIEDQTIFYRGSRYVDPLYLNSIDVVDNFPKETKLKRRGSASHLAPEALSAFCFPNGISIRLLPRCAVEGAKRMEWLGRDSDRYQLHAFTNGSGERTYGIAITIREEISCSDDSTLSTILDYLKTCRDKRRSARIISQYWRNFRQKCEKYFNEEAERLDGKKNLFSRAMTFGESSKHSSIVEIMKDTLMRTNSNSSTTSTSVNPIKKPVSSDVQSCSSEKIIPQRVKRLAAEAYKFMIEADSVGDVCIVENCYVMLGTKLQDQSLILSALQKIIDVEREDQAIRMRFRQLGNSTTHDLTSIVSENRTHILQAMQSKLRLSKEQITKTFCIRDDNDLFEVDLELGSASMITLPLPLPYMSGEWGVATLVRSIKVHNLLMVLKLLLMERSILLVGTRGEEVSACACALLELLKPYKWASAFMPILPVDLLDIVESPVPFIGGIIVKDEVSLEMLEHDSRVKNAMEQGLSLINLTSKTFSPTLEEGVIDFMRRCHDPISHELLYYQSKLLDSMKKKKSALNCFKTFFECGATRKEAKLVESMRNLIKEHFLALGCISQKKPDSFKDFGQFDPDTGEFDFYPEKLLEPLRAQLEFQEAMISTQLFLSYIEEKKNNFDLLEGQSAIFIADWLYFHWKRYQYRKSSVIRKNRTSLER